MLGEHALSAQPLATQSILQFGSASADLNFVMSSDFANFLASGEISIEAISSISRVGSGTLIGTIGATFEFEQSTTPLRFASAISAMSFDTIQTTQGTYIASAISEQEAAFIVEAAGTSVLSGVSEQNSEFTQDTAPNMLYSAVSEQIAEFIQSTNASATYSNSFSIESVFIQTSLGSIVKDPGPVAINAIFVQTTDGRLLWERIDADQPAENWVQIAPTGGTWTEINASGIIDNWTEKVV